MTVREVMTLKPVTLQASVPVIEAARAMSQYNLGDIVVQKNGKLCGIVTDRDIVIRVLGSGKDPKMTSLESICSQELATISPDQPTSDAVRIMRERAIRRLPVVENDRVVGIVSLGDLAVRLDARSALASISAAPPSH
jgi:CBS domain-containing protein